MRIGELSSRTGVSVRSLRYYEEQGLLHPQRTDSGQRVYTDDAIERVRFFQSMFAAGLSSQRIYELLPCMTSGTTDHGQRQMLRTERERIAQEVVALETALKRLDDVIRVADDRAATTSAST